jgi:hypothetical protein
MSNCAHCGAKRPNLQTFTEHAGADGRFEVARCLLCGWQLCRLIPRKRRRLPDMTELVYDEETPEERIFLNFAFKAAALVNPYIGSSLEKQRNTVEFKEGFNMVPE